MKETKTNNQVMLSEVENGKTFKIGDVTYIKFKDENGKTIAVTKDSVCRTRFGKDNNLKNSKVLKELETKFLPKVAEIIGEENICTFETDLTTLDGLKNYGVMESKISLPTFDFYRENVEIFDKYKLDEWWWLATPDSAEPHYSPVWICCVSPRGDIGSYCYYFVSGVRPILHFVSTIFVSVEE